MASFHKKKTLWIKSFSVNTTPQHKIYLLQYMTYIPIARQRLGKHASTIKRLFSMLSAPLPLLCTGALNTPKSIRDKRRRCFTWSPCKVVTKKNSTEQPRVQSQVPRSQPARIWTSNWTDSSLRNWQLQNNDTKGIRLRKEDSMCDLKWQWYCYKSVAWIRLVKTEKPSACWTVNCKVCRSAIALNYLSWWGVNLCGAINPIIQSKTHLISHRETWQIIQQMNQGFQVVP
jgi:hypothetical protein